MTANKIILSQAEVSIIVQMLVDCAKEESIFPRYETISKKVIDVLYRVSHDGKMAYGRSVDKIKEIYANYLCGHYTCAYENFKELMKSVLSLLDYETMHEGTTLFRARKFNKEKEPKRIMYTKDEMWPVSMGKREKAALHRFGILGHPMFYLGRSEYVCWEEHNRPHLDEIVFAEVKVEKEFQVLDLRLKRDTEIPLAILPLIIACSMYVNDRTSAFKEEFIISEMVCRWLNGKYREEVKEIEEQKRDRLQHGGVMYSSTRTFRTMEDVSSRNIDYMALPTYIREDTVEDNTSILKKYLAIKEPYCKGYQCVLNSLDI